MSFNTFGHLFRVTTFGESHGPAIGCVVDGCPPGIPLTEADIQPYLDKRRPGQSRFTTQRQEPDTVKILSGVFADEDTGGQVTTGTPIALLIENVDQRSKDYSAIKDIYRPGHAGYTYDVKYGLQDYRGGGRASARETAMRVAAGAIARKIVPGLTVRGALIQMGTRTIDRAAWDWAEVERNPFFCPDAKAATGFADYLDDVRKKGSSVGAVIEVIAEGVPPGLGAPIYSKLDGDLAGAIMGINAVKGVEIGAGFRRGVTVGRGQCRRDAHGQRRQAAVSLQPCGRHPGRHLHRTAGGRALRRQADIVDPHAAQDGRPLRQRDRGLHQGPPRSVRAAARRADRRGDGGVRDCGPLSASSGSGRRTAGMALQEMSRVRNVGV